MFEEEEELVVSNYRLPNKKLWLLTTPFLTEFKKDLANTFGLKEDESNYISELRYLPLYNGFYDTLKVTSEKFNVTKAIYGYSQKLSRLESEAFANEILDTMLEKDLILDETYPKRKVFDLDFYQKQLVDEGKVKEVIKLEKHKGYSRVLTYLEEVEEV